MTSLKIPNEYLLKILLPFHKVDDLFYEAVESCLLALPQNSIIILINTSLNSDLHLKAEPKLKILEAAGSPYLEALKIGMEFGSSKYVALMNSDDLVASSRFIDQIEEIRKHGLDVCMTDIQKFSKENSIIPALLGKSPPFFDLALLLLGAYRADATWCFTSEWAKKVQLFEIEEDDSDWSVALRVLPDAKVGLLKKTMYFYRMHAGQITRKRVTPANNLKVRLKNLNTGLNFPSLRDASLFWLIAPNKKIDRRSYKELSIWLSYVEKYLSTKYPNAKDDISNLIQRRQVLLHIYRRKIPTNVKILVKSFTLIAEYLRFNRYVRFSPKNSS